MTPREPRKLRRALVASLLLHALLLGFLFWTTSRAPTVGPHPKPLEVELVMIPATAALPPAQPLPALRPKRSASPASASRTPTAPLASQTVSSAPAPAAPPGEQADSPRSSSSFLVPRVGFVLPGLGSADDSEAAGHTLRNGPGEEPDQRAVDEYTAERNKAMLDEQLGELVASAQRENGLVDPYFTRLQADLREGFRGADVKIAQRTTQEMVQQEVVETYTGPASRFAKTGDPMADPEQARQLNESSFGRLLERGGSQLGDSHDQRTLEAGMQSMAFTQVIRDSAQRVRLKTVLMLRQDGDGALAEATVLEHSGDSQFDEFVLHLSRKVVRDQGDTSEDGGAPSALGWSSVWQFTWEPPRVKVKLLRVLRAARDSPLQGAQ